MADRVRHVVQSAFNGKRIIIFSGGETKNDMNALLDDVRGIRDGGGFGMIMGRNAFQRPHVEAMKLVTSVMDIFAGKA
jgi:class I fructose-bisphosphate aldolase